MTAPSVSIDLSAVTVAPANEGDIPALCGLLTLLFEQEAEFAPDSEKQKRGLSMVISRPEQGLILVARHGEQIVGMVSLLYTWSTALGGRVALLEDLQVLPECRNQGIGSKLLQHALCAARQMECLRITLLTDCDNQRAQVFYQRWGFVLSPMIPMRCLL